jgi:hypothetical protein
MLNSFKHLEIVMTLQFYILSTEKMINASDASTIPRKGEHVRIDCVSREVVNIVHFYNENATLSTVVYLK